LIIKKGLLHSAAVLFSVCILIGGGISKIPFPLAVPEISFAYARTFRPLRV